LNVLDENITRDQQDLLRHWGVRFRSIVEFGMRFLRHSAFRYKLQRLGKVIRVHPDGIAVLTKHERLVEVRWDREA
jgi:hypothetical protein